MTGIAAPKKGSSRAKVGGTMKRASQSAARKRAARVALKAIDALKEANPAVLPPDHWKLLKKVAKRNIREHHENLKKPKHVLSIQECIEILQTLYDLCIELGVRRQFHSEGQVSKAALKRIRTNLVEHFGAKQGRLVFTFRSELYEELFKLSPRELNHVFLPHYPRDFCAHFKGCEEMISLVHEYGKIRRPLSRGLRIRTKKTFAELRNCRGQLAFSSPLPVAEIRLGYALINALALISITISFKLGLTYRKKGSQIRPS